MERLHFDYSAFEPEYTHLRARRRAIEEGDMPAQQGDIALLQDPVAQALLQSTIPARLAYTWTDGTPRVVPIWFHWNGSEFVLGSPRRAPKLKALRQQPRVALTIDSDGWPPKVLLVRGNAAVELVEGLPQEFAACARRYLGDEQGQTFIEQFAGMTQSFARIVIRPDWAGILDFETRFPSAVS
jgi:hypothetical protein